MVKSYKDLGVWQKAIILTDEIYALTEAFPKPEIYGLVNQMRRAAVSIASNIAEGSARGRKEFIQFVSIARGSLAELETQCIIASRRKFISDENYGRINALSEELSRMLMGLLKSLKSD